MNAPGPNPEPRRITFEDAIYEFCSTILYYTYAVDEDLTRSFNEREDIAKRLCRVMHAILALTLRMNFYKIGKHFFAAMRQPPVRTPKDPHPEDEPEDEPGSMRARPGRKPPHLRSPLSARNTARRLAALLRELDAIIHEYTLTGTEEIVAISNWLRDRAGCDTLPECRPFTPTKPPRPRLPTRPHSHKPGVQVGYDPDDWAPRR